MYKCIYVFASQPNRSLPSTSSMHHSNPIPTIYHQSFAHTVPFPTPFPTATTHIYHPSHPPPRNHNPHIPNRLLHPRPRYPLRQFPLPSDRSNIPHTHDRRPHRQNLLLRKRPPLAHPRAHTPGPQLPVPSHEFAVGARLEETLWDEGLRGGVHGGVVVGEGHQG